MQSMSDEENQNFILDMAPKQPDTMTYMVVNKCVQNRRR